MMVSWNLSLLGLGLLAYSRSYTDLRHIRDRRLKKNRRRDLRLTKRDAKRERGRHDAAYRPLPRLGDLLSFIQGALAREAFEVASANAKATQLP
jgi:hypothetical protein